MSPGSPAGSPRHSPAGSPHPSPHYGAATPSLQINPGEALADRFTVKCLLGHGGFGSAYLVDDAVTQRELALKVVPTQLGSATLAVDQLMFEYQARKKIHNTKHILSADLPLTCDFKGLSLILGRCQGRCRLFMPHLL
jgi:serine/threonine protein kinase